jgi:hypothetical protein
MCDPSFLGLALHWHCELREPNHAPKVQPAGIERDAQLPCRRQLAAVAGKPLNRF